MEIILHILLHRYTRVQKIILYTNNIWHSGKKHILENMLFMSELNKQLHQYYDSKEDILLTTSDERGEGEQVTEKVKWDSEEIVKVKFIEEY